MTDDYQLHYSGSTTTPILPPKEYPSGVVIIMVPRGPTIMPQEVEEILKEKK